MKLIEEGFYDGVKFHRVIKGFMAQAGDPNSKKNDFNGQLGQKSYGETIPAELISEYIHKEVLWQPQEWEIMSTQRKNLVEVSST